MNGLFVLSRKREVGQMTKLSVAGILALILSGAVPARTAIAAPFIPIPPAVAPFQDLETFFFHNFFFRNFGCCAFFGEFAPFCFSEQSLRLDGECEFPPPPSLPDLVPVSPPGLVPPFCEPGATVGPFIVVRVQNQGLAPAGPSVTTISFRGVVPPEDVDTPALGLSGAITLSILSPCPSCTFDIVVDSKGPPGRGMVDESLEANNFASGRCE
jgi:hypothetical protein